jgi:putative FmdB family regulatory protein
MPIYDFHCEGCGRNVSLLLRSVSSASPERCPECGSADFRRTISRFAFHKSAETKLHELDPKYEKMIDDSSPDLSMDNIIRNYNLDKPLKTDERGVPDL